MATSDSYKNYVLTQLHVLDNISYKPMMGEYLLYYNGILFGGIYDDRLLIKKTVSNKRYGLEEAIPYENAKPMYWLNNLDDQDDIRNIILDTCDDLSNKVKE